MTEPVHLEIADRVARLTFNRPPVNALALDLLHAFRDAAESLTGRRDVGVVLLGTSGPNFSVGGDLRSMQAAGDDAARAIHDLAGVMHAGIEALSALDAPVIAAVRGAAAGAGMAIAIGADLVLAAESAHFTVAYTAVGLAPDGGMSWTLPKVVGLRKATELALLNERLSAQQAHALGLVTRVVPDGELDAAADALAARLAHGPVGAHGAVKRLLRASYAQPLAQQLADEATAIAGQAGGRDGREGIAAFLGKRAPHFGES